MLISNGWFEYERRTPQTLIEAVMVVVRERGVAALKDHPDTSKRLLLCDEAACAQINARIAKLMAEGRIPETENA